jgi:hypothetical protein
MDLIMIRQTSELNNRTAQPPTSDYAYDDVLQV